MPAILVFVTMALSQPAFGQEQSRETMAVDATASQWSYQFALEGNFDYKDDTLDNVQTRPEVNKGFLQFRLVAPIAKSEKIPITMLPRLTLRLVENQQSDFGFGNSDIFVLGSSTSGTQAVGGSVRRSTFRPKPGLVTRSGAWDWPEPSPSGSSTMTCSW